MTVGSTSPSHSPENSEGTGGAEAQRHSARGRHPDSYCWGLAPLSGESNGTSFSSKAFLSIAGLEEKKRFLCYLLWGGRRWEKLTATLSHVLMGAGASERLTMEAGFLILSGPASLYAGGCPAMFGTIRLLTLWAGAEHREGRRL